MMINSSAMRNFFNRFYSDYLLPDRIPVYERINQLGLDSGYTFKTTLEVYEESVLRQHPQVKSFIHRHDIDTDTKTAQRFFDSEKKLGIKTSYYFRLSTIDIGLMKEINAYGSEVGYHYEELAQYCKDHKIKTWEDAKKKLPEIRQRFSDNFLNLQSKLGFKIKTIASHGDFVNRKLGHTNGELIDEELLHDLAIDLECYNPQLVKHFDVTLSDQPYPRYYRDQSPEDAIAEKINCIYLLTHTRHWHVARWENTKDNIQRFSEGLKYRF
jgi:hypothetical protein